MHLHCHLLIVKKLSQCNNDKKDAEISENPCALDIWFRKLITVAWYTAMQ